jgi:hypothetical protein
LTLSTMLPQMAHRPFLYAHLWQRVAEFCWTDCCEQSAPSVFTAPNPNSISHILSTHLAINALVPIHIHAPLTLPRLGIRRSTRTRRQQLVFAYYSRLPGRWLCGVRSRDFGEFLRGLSALDSDVGAHLFARLADHCGKLLMTNETMQKVECSGWWMDAS